MRPAWLAIFWASGLVRLAAAKDFDSASPGGGVGAVASQDGDVERSAVGVSGYDQDDLRSVGTVVAAVSVAREGSGTGAFEVDAGEVVESEADGGFECLGGGFFFQSAPVTGEGVHGGVEVVLIEVFVAGEAAGCGEQRALGGVFEGEFRTGEEEPGEDHGLEKSALAGSADVGEEEVEIQGFPSIDEEGKTAEIEGGVEFDGVGLKGGFAGKSGSDEVADFGRELGDVADGAGAGAVGSAKRFADEMGGVGFAVFPRLGGLNKHVLHKYPAKHVVKCKKQ